MKAGGKPMEPRCALGSIQVKQMDVDDYIADVWRSGRGLSMVDVFVEAAGEVWRLAKRRGVE